MAVQSRKEDICVLHDRWKSRHHIHLVESLTNEKEGREERVSNPKRTNRDRKARVVVRVQNLKRKE